MKVRGPILQVLALVVAVGCATACKSATGGTQPTTLAETDVAPAGPAVEPEAVAIVERAAALIRNAKSLRVDAVTGFDVLQSDGQKIEFGSSWTASIQRPARARLESQRRDGVRVVVVLDGNDLWVYSPDHDAYGREPQPGDIDVSLNYLLDELDISTPLHSLFSSELGSRLDEGLSSCFLVGDSTIAGRTCHHVAARKDYTDFQLWIDKGDVPALRRIVISYREEEGHPQYWAYFREWDFAAKPAAGTFVFQPPAGTERVRIAHADEGEEQGDE